VSHTSPPRTIFASSYFFDPRRLSYVSPPNLIVRLYLKPLSTRVVLVCLVIVKIFDRRRSIPEMSEGDDEDSPSRPPKVSVDHDNPVQPSLCISSLSKIAPVVVSAIDKPGFFLSLKFADTNSFVDDLARLVKPVKNVEFVSGGDLFVFPFDLEQKHAILNLNCINNLKVSCKLTKSESEFRGVIVGVPCRNRIARLC
jgi:hypothetical protein